MAQDPGQIREEIEHTRAELAATVQALGEKADVKGRIKSSAAETIDRVQDKTRDLREHLNDATPDGAKQTLAAVIQKAAERPAPLWLGVGFVTGLLIGRQMGRGA